MKNPLGSEENSGPKGSEMCGVRALCSVTSKSRVRRERNVFMTGTESETIIRRAIGVSWLKVKYIFVLELSVQVQSDSEYDR